jgi:hypothetical protein
MSTHSYPSLLSKNPKIHVLNIARSLGNHPKHYTSRVKAFDTVFKLEYIAKPQPCRIPIITRYGKSPIIYRIIARGEVFSVGIPSSEVSTAKTQARRLRHVYLNVPLQLLHVPPQPQLFQPSVRDEAGGIILSQ